MVDICSNDSYVLLDIHVKGYGRGMDRETIGTQVRQIRLARGLTQRELAERAGVSEPTVISRIERGGQVPRLDTAARIAHALGVPLGELAGMATDADPIASAPALSRDQRQQRLIRGLDALGDDAIVLLLGLVEQLGATSGRGQ